MAAFFSTRAFSIPLPIVAMLPLRQPVPPHPVVGLPERCCSCQNHFRGRRGMNLHLRQNQICSAFYASMDSSNRLYTHDTPTLAALPDAAASLRSASYPASGRLPYVYADDDAFPWNADQDESFPSNVPKISVTRVLRSKSTWVSKSIVANTTLHETVVVKTMNDEDSANDSDSVDSITEAKAEFPVNVLVESSGTATNLPDSVVLPAEGSGFPNGTVRTLQHQLTALKSDHFGMDRFSMQDKMQLELLHILKSHRLPLNTFAPTLKFAVKLNSLGISLSDAPKTRKTIIAKLFRHYNMEALAPQQKACLLPIAQTSVNVVYFNARAVFASLLSCPNLNQDHKYMFRDPTNVFASPIDECGHNAPNVIGEINTGTIYKATYSKLIVNNNKDMLLPAIFGLDKTHIDTGSRLQMEPLTISHGLLKHEFRCQPSAMRILGYINLLPVHYHASRLPMLPQQN